MFHKITNQRISKLMVLMMILTQFPPGADAAMTFQGVFGSDVKIGGTTPVQTRTIDIGGHNNASAQAVTETLPTDGTRKLFYLSHQPIHRIQGISGANVLGVTVDGLALLPRDASTKAANWSYSVRNGWITFNTAYAAAKKVMVTYEYLQTPDVYAGNDGNQSNFMYFDNGSSGSTFAFTDGFPASASASTAKGIAVGDSNNDGSSDVLLGNSAEAVGVYSQAAGGLYTGTTPDPDTQDTSGVVWGDFNNDGLLDYAEANSGGKQSKLYMATTGGAFISYSWNIAAGNWQSIDFGDFDNDGDLDIAIGQFNGKTEIWRNDVVGGSVVAPSPSEKISKYDSNDLTLVSVTANTPSGVIPTGAAIDADFIYVISRTGSIYKYDRDDLTTPIDSLINNYLPLSNDIDVSGDYIYAGVKTVSNTKYLRKYRKKDLSFVNEVWIGYGVMGEGIGVDPTGTYVYVSDMQGTNQNGSFGGRRIKRFKTSDLSPQGEINLMAYADNFDVAVDNNYVYILLAGVGVLRRSVNFSDNTSKLFSMPTNFGIASEADGSRVYLSQTEIKKYQRNDFSFVEGSWTGPGDPDPAAQWTIGCDRDVVVNRFKKVWESPAPMPTREVQWSDTDNDGDLDLVVANDGEASQVYRNDGGGTPTMTLSWQSPTNTATKSVAVGRLDGDALPDLVFANGTNSPAISIYKNAGGGNFIPDWNSSSASAAYDNYNAMAVRLADFNNDGKLEIAAAAASGTYKGIAVYAQSGPSGRKTIRISTLTRKNGVAMRMICTYSVTAANGVGELLSTELKPE